MQEKIEGSISRSLLRKNHWKRNMGDAWCVCRWAGWASLNVEATRNCPKARVIAAQGYPKLVEVAQN